jgi:hypothetical protein
VNLPYHHNIQPSINRQRRSGENPVSILLKFGLYIVTKVVKYLKIGGLSLWACRRFSLG